MKVVLISGKARHGKDTVCDAIKEELERCGRRRVVVIRYADLLKFICEKYFGWDGNKDEEGRKLLQTIGTDVVRKKNPNYWVKFVISLLTMFNSCWQYVLIPDCRFPNEIERIKAKFDAVHVRVVRPNFDNGLTEEQKMHESETALDGYPCDIELLNDGTLRDLKIKAAVMTMCNL